MSIRSNEKEGEKNKPTYHLSPRSPPPFFFPSLSLTSSIDLHLSLSARSQNLETRRKRNPGHPPAGLETNSRSTEVLKKNLADFIPFHSHFLGTCMDQGEEEEENKGGGFWEWKGEGKGSGDVNIPLLYTRK